MKPPVLPEDPERRREHLVWHRSAVAVATVAALFAAAITVALIVHQESYRLRNPLEEQRRAADGTLVDKPLVAARKELLAQARRLQDLKGERPDQDAPAAEREDWQRRMNREEATLKAAQRAYREADKAWTQAYFDLEWRFKTGSWFLLGALIVFVLVLELARTAKPDLELPRGKHPMTRALADARLARILVAILALLLLVLAVYVAYAVADPLAAAAEAGGGAR